MQECNNGDGINQSGAKYVPGQYIKTNELKSTKNKEYQV